MNIEGFKAPMIGGGGSSLLAGVDMWDGHTDFMKRRLAVEDLTFGDTVSMTEVHLRAIGLGLFGTVLLIVGVVLYAKAFTRKKKP